MASSAAPMPTNLADIPAAPPPPGVTPNFVNPESRTPLAVGLSAAVMALMLIFLTLRFYTKTLITRKLGWEDWSALLGATLTVANTSLVIAICELGGVGPHSWNVPLSDITPAYQQRFLVSQGLYSPAIYFIKLSIFLLYLRIFGNKGSASRIWILAGIGVSTVVYFLLWTLDLAYCVPNFAVDGIVKGDCANKGGQAIWAQTAFNIISDVYLLAIPTIVISKLQMPTSKKIGIIAVLATGLLSTVCTILTMVYRIEFIDDTDPSWDLIPNAILVNMETNIGVICSCLPTLPALWRHQDGGRAGAWTLRSLLSRFKGSQVSKGRFGRSDYSDRLSDHSTQPAVKNNGIERTVGFGYSVEDTHDLEMEER